MSNNVLYRSLPEKIIETTSRDDNAYIQALLQKDLPRSDSKNIQNDLQWQFLLDKHQSQGKKPKKIRKKKTFLTRKERKALQILKLPRDGWDYASLEPMRQMWRQYMKHNLDLSEKLPTCEDKTWANFSMILARSELIGSQVKVARSKTPSLVGVEGTVVLETKMTFQIVTPLSQLKILPKAQSVFEFTLDKIRFTVFGKNIMTKPSERSVKKIKSHMLPDL